jgi:hypothetical protein
MGIEASFNASHCRAKTAFLLGIYGAITTFSPFPNKLSMRSKTKLLCAEMCCKKSCNRGGDGYYCSCEDYSFHKLLSINWEFDLIG